MKAQKLLPLIVVVAGLVAYLNTLTCPFIFDDFGSIVENPTIRQLWPPWQALAPPHSGGVGGRPIINLSLAVNYALGGLDVWGYHAFNLAIHILSGLTLLGIVRRTLLQPGLRERFGSAANGLALAVAVLWTVHPLQTESVTCIIQRSESLMSLFYLLTLYCFIRGTESPGNERWYDLCLGACALGMASKEVMVSAPLMAMLYDRTFISGSFREAWRRRRSLYQALAATWILLALLVITTGSESGMRGFGIDVSWWQYALIQVRAIVLYLRLAFWPYPLVLDYGLFMPGRFTGFPPQTLIVALLLAATAVSLWRWPAIGFVGAWFLAILAPSSSVVPLAGQVMAEHRMYLPLAAVVVLVVIGLHAWLGRRSLPVFLVVAIGLGFVTIRRNEDYHSALAILQDTIAKQPDNPRAYANLGQVLAAAGKNDEAVAPYEQALRLKPDYAEVYDNLALARVRQGRLQDAIGNWESALRVKPDFAKAHYNLGFTLEQMGRTNDALQHYQQALRIRPDYPEARNNLARLLFEPSNAPTP